MIWGGSVGKVRGGRNAIVKRCDFHPRILSSHHHSELDVVGVGGAIEAGGIDSVNRESDGDSEK